MRKSNFLKKSISLMLAGVMILALATPMADSQAQDTADNSYDVSEFRKEGTAYTYPTKVGCVFAGWYTDADYQTPLGTDVTEGDAYAKFVSEDVLKVKYQLPVTTSETDTTTSIRLITSVDSIDYQSVGFKVEYTDNGTTQTREFTTRNVYSIIKGIVDGRVVIKYKSQVFSEASSYLMAVIINKLPMSIYNSGLTVTAQWVTLDGTTVSGETRNLQDSQTSSAMSTSMTAGLYTLDYVEKDVVYVSGGKYGKAFSTNHRTGVITSLNGCNFGTSDFAVSGWFKAPAMSSLSTGSNNYLFGICPPDTVGGFSIQIKQQSGAVKLRINTVDGKNQQPTITDYTENEWMHLAVVRSGDTMQVYLNGTSMISGDGYALTAGYDFGNPKLTFGAYEGWLNNYRDASIWFDDLRVYGQALTTDEVTAITNNTDNTTDEATGTVTYSPAPTAHVTFDNSTVENTGTNTSISATLYKLDEAKKFVKSTKFVATGGVGTSVAGKYNEGIQTHHRTGANTVLEGYNFGANDFTISCWFKTPALSSLGSGPNNYLFGIGTPNTANVFSIQLKKDGSTPKLRINNLAGGNSQPKIANYTANTWMHLAAVRSGDTLQVYLDGVSMYTYDFSTTEYAGIDFGSPKLALGSYPGMTGNYQDTSTWFDDLRLYNSALTADEIGYVKAGTHSSVASPVALVTYDDGIVVNTGTDSSIKVGLYKMSAINASAGSNDFVEYNTTTGRDEAAFGAVQMKHTEGPYTVLNGYNFGIHDFTVSTWFNVPTDSSNVSGGSGTYLFGIAQPDASEGFAVSMKSGNIRLRLNGTTYQPAVTYEKGTWNNVALSRIDNTVKIYFNDTLLKTYSIDDNFDFGTKQLAFGGYYGSSNNYHGNIMLFDDMAVTIEGFNTILTSTKGTIKPEAEVTYTGGTIANTGTDSTLTVGAYSINSGSTDFAKTSSVSYTTGVEGDENGAISMTHKSGAYTVVEDYPFGADDFTISTWFNVPLDASQKLSTGDGTYLFGTDSPDGNGTTGFSVCLKDGQLRLKVKATSEIVTMAFEKNTWYNLVLRRAGSVMEVYLNGTLVPTTLTATDCDFGTKDLAFGGYYGYLNSSGGVKSYHSNKMCYDNIQVYNEALSADFIRYAVQAMEHKITWLTDGNHEMTTLFVGDSFFSERSYWTNFYDTYAGKDVYCAGIAATTTYDWDVFADSYLAYTSPKNLVVHLGTNNIHTDGDNAEAAIQNLQALFTKIHGLETYQDTQIYYFGIPYKKSTMYGDGKAFSEEYKTTIDTVNATMEAWCAKQGWITYIGDLTGGAIADEQFRDNTHLTLEDYSLITNALANTDIVIEESGFNFEADTTYRTRDTLTKTANTLSSWIYLPEAYASRGGVIWGNYEHTSIPCVGYEIQTNGQPRFYHVNAPGQVVDLKFANVDIRADKWVNLTFVVEEDMRTVSCYLDGEFKQQLVAGDEIKLDAVTEVYTLGGDLRDNNAQYFKGRIKELALYESTLSAEQVKALYTTGLGQTDVAPFTYYQLRTATEGEDVSDVKDANNLVARGRYFTEQVPVEDYAYSFAVIGDPQIISINDYKYGNSNLTGIYDWILENKTAKNIQYVFNMGDITDGNLPAEWSVAQTQNARMDGVVPYSVLRGNHDLVGYNNQGDTDYFSQYMGTTAYKAQFEGFYNDADISNSWRTLTIGETNYLLLTLDYGVLSHYGVKTPTDAHKTEADAILAWAGEVITSHPNHKVILTTHAYMNNDGTTLDVNDASNPSELHGTYDGDYLWDNFVSQYENIVLVMSGHIDSEKVVVRQDTGVHGNTVTSMLINFQGVDRYQELTGMVTMLYFSKDGKSIQVENYSTVQEAYFLESNQFTIDIVKPEVDIDYTGGTITNNGTDDTLTVGSYKINATNDGFDTSTDVIYITGKDGDANGALKMKHDHLKVDNGGSYMVVKDYEFGTKNFAISAWFKVPENQTISTGSNSYLFGIKEPNATTGFSVCLKPTTLRFRVDGVNQTAETISYELDTWNHVVLCREGTALKLYFNGTLVSTTTLSNGYSFGTADLAFGGYYGFVNSEGVQNYYQNSWIYYDDIQVYNATWTAEEIAAWYDEQK